MASEKQAMDRRSKHVRIIEHFEVESFRHFQRFTLQHGLRLFTDEAIEEYAAWLVRDARRTAKINRQNRAMAQSAAVSA